MLDIFFSIFIYLLAFYGVIVLVITIANSISDRSYTDNPGIRLVLLVKDNADRIEGVIRGVYSGACLKRLFLNDRLTVVDMGSKDETKKILERLAWEYSTLEILDDTQKEMLFSSFENSN